MIITCITIIGRCNVEVLITMVVQIALLFRLLRTRLLKSLRIQTNMVLQLTFDTYWVCSSGTNCMFAITLQSCYRSSSKSDDPKMQ